MASIFITGASGFVGTHVVQMLRDRGHQVTGLMRHPTAALPGFLAADLLVPGHYADALAPADVVIHLAAATGKRARDEYRRTNIEGTRALLEACARAGGPRFLFVSTIAVRFGELAKYPYAESKLVAERMVADSGLPYTNIRPTMVSGPGSPVFTGLARLAGMPVIPAFGGAGARVQPILVSDLAGLVCDLVESGAFLGQTLEFGGPEVTTVRDLLARIHRRIRETPARFVNIPLAAVLPLISAMERWAPRAVPITVGQLATFRYDGLAEPNPIWTARRDRLTTVEEMITLSLAS